MTSIVSRVGDRHGDVDNVVPESWVASRLNWARLGNGGDGVLEGRDFDVGGIEGGVAETKAELVANGNVVSIEVAVVNLKTLIKPRLPVIDAGGVDSGGRRGIVISAVECDCVREMA